MKPNSRGRSESPHVASYEGEGRGEMKDGAPLQALANEPQALHRYIRHLPPDAPPAERRDVEGKLLPPGTRVLSHPLAPQEFMEDVATQRARFRAQHCAWSAQVRQRVWFPPIHALSDGCRTELERVKAIREAFLAALDENLKSADGLAFPLVRAPRWFKFIPYEWEPKIRRTVPLADLTLELASALESHGGTPDGLPWTEEWRRLMQQCHALRIYAVDGRISKVHVVVAFVAPLRFEEEREPRFVVPGQGVLATVRRVYDKSLAEEGWPAPSFTFLTMALFRDVTDANETDSDADRIAPLILGPGSSRRQEALILNSALRTPHTAFERWTSTIPGHLAERKSLRDFSDRLLPETQEKRVTQMKRCVDDLLQTHEGNVTLDLVYRETGYQRAAVRDCFLMLQVQGPDDYRLYRTSESQWAIRRASKGEPVTIPAPSIRGSAARRHVIRILNTAASLFAGQVVSQLINRGAWWGLAIGALIAYVMNCVQVAITRRLSHDRD